MPATLLILSRAFTITSPSVGYHEPQWAMHAHKRVPDTKICCSTVQLTLRCCVYLRLMYRDVQIQFDAGKAIQDSISALDVNVVTEAVLQHAGTATKVCARMRHPCTGDETDLCSRGLLGLGCFVDSGDVLGCLASPLLP